MKFFWVNFINTLFTKFSYGFEHRWNQVYTFCFIHKYYYWLGYFRKNHALTLFVGLFFCVITEIRKFFAKRSARSSLHRTKMKCLIVYYVVSSERKFERVSHHLCEPHMVITSISTASNDLSPLEHLAPHATVRDQNTQIKSISTFDHRIVLNNMKRHTFLLICKRKYEWENSFGEIFAIKRMASNNTLIKPIVLISTVRNVQFEANIRTCLFNMHQLYSISKLNETSNTWNETVTFFCVNLHLKWIPTPFIGGKCQNEKCWTGFRGDKWCALCKHDITRHFMFNFQISVFHSRKI